MHHWKWQTGARVQKNKNWLCTYRLWSHCKDFKIYSKIMMTDWLRKNQLMRIMISTQCLKKKAYGCVRWQISRKICCSADIGSNMQHGFAASSRYNKIYSKITFSCIHALWSNNLGIYNAYHFSAWRLWMNKSLNNPCMPEGKDAP